MMRLIVRDKHKQFNRQTHAYAEYRAFSSLVGSERRVSDVTVTLTRGPVDGTEDDGTVVCTIAITMASDEVAEVQAVAPHAYAAIDRAVSLIRHTPLAADGRPVRNLN